MFEKFFRKNKQNSGQQNGETSKHGDLADKDRSSVNSIRNMTDNSQESERLPFLKSAGQEIAQRIFGILKTEKGVHVETYLAILSSLAGFSCQMGIWRELDLKSEDQRVSPFVVVSGADGKTYFFGDILNGPLAEDTYSIWALSAGMAQHLGCQQLPDINAIFSHVSQTIGGPDFGIPQLPENRKPDALPIQYVKTIWPHMLPLLQKLCQRPSEWSCALGFALQHAITEAKDVINPAEAVKIIMECAVPMSKIDPNEIPQVDRS